MIYSKNINREHYSKKIIFPHGNCPGCGFPIRYLFFKILTPPRLRYRCSNCKSLISRKNSVISFIISMILIAYLAILLKEHNTSLIMIKNAWVQYIILFFILLQMLIIFSTIYGIIGKYYLEYNALISNNRSKTILSFFQNDILWKKNPYDIAHELAKINNQLELIDDHDLWIIVSNKLNQFYGKKEADIKLQKITDTYLQLLK